MIPSLILAAAVILLPIIYVIATFNRLVNLNNLIRNSWQNVETELKRRYDLIPNLVSTVKGYASHEKDVLHRLVAAREEAVKSTGSPRTQATDENKLVRALRGLFVVVEAYPHLKASANFLALQDELINTENRIQAARRFYNGNVKDLNNLIGQFPSNLIASSFEFRPAEFFEIESAVERKGVAVKL
jgi:LemA protein